MILALSRDPRLAALWLCDKDIKPQLEEIVKLFKAFRSPPRRARFRDPWRRWFAERPDNAQWLYWYAWFLNIRHVHRFKGFDYGPFDEVIVPIRNSLLKRARFKGAVTPFPVLVEKDEPDPVLSYQKWYVRNRKNTDWDRPEWAEVVAEGDGIFDREEFF